MFVRLAAELADGRVAYRATGELLGCAPRDAYLQSPLAFGLGDPGDSS